MRNHTIFIILWEFAVLLGMQLFDMLFEGAKVVIELTTILYNAFVFDSWSLRERFKIEVIKRKEVINFRTWFYLDSEKWYNNYLIKIL